MIRVQLRRKLQHREIFKKVFTHSVEAYYGSYAIYVEQHLPSINVNVTSYSSKVSPIIPKKSKKKRWKCSGSSYSQKSICFWFNGKTITSDNAEFSSKLHYDLDINNNINKGTYDLPVIGLGIVFDASMFRK